MVRNITPVLRLKVKVLKSKSKSKINRKSVKIKNLRPIRSIVFLYCSSINTVMVYILFFATVLANIEVSCFVVRCLALDHMFGVTPF